jgi:hypothetical protein
MVAEVVGEYQNASELARTQTTGDSGGWEMHPTQMHRQSQPRRSLVDMADCHRDITRVLLLFWLLLQNLTFLLIVFRISNNSVCRRPQIPVAAARRHKRITSRRVRLGIRYLFNGLKKTLVFDCKIRSDGFW